jgi:hypothetical protein
LSYEIVGPWMNDIPGDDSLGVTLLIILSRWNLISPMHGICKDDRLWRISSCLVEGLQKEHESIVPETVHTLHMVQLSGSHIRNSRWNLISSMHGICEDARLWGICLVKGLQKEHQSIVPERAYTLHTDHDTVQLSHIRNFKTQVW